MQGGLKFVKYVLDPEETKMKKSTTVDSSNLFPDRPTNSNKIILYYQSLYIITPAADFIALTVCSHRPERLRNQNN